MYIDQNFPVFQAVSIRSRNQFLVFVFIRSSQHLDWWTIKISCELQDALILHDVAFSILYCLFLEVISVGNLSIKTCYDVFFRYLSILLLKLNQFGECYILLNLLL